MGEIVLYTLLVASGGGLTALWAILVASAGAQVKEHKRGVQVVLTVLWALVTVPLFIWASAIAPF